MNNKYFMSVINFVNDFEYEHGGELAVSAKQGGIELAERLGLITEEEAKECYRALIEHCGFTDIQEGYIDSYEEGKKEGIIAIDDFGDKVILTWECLWFSDSFGDRMFIVSLEYCAERGIKVYTMDNVEITE